MGVICYTAIFGDISDQLHVPIHLPTDCRVRFVCFSDQQKPTGPWEILPAVASFATPRRTARWHKIQAHKALPSHSLSIWVDGCLTVRRDPVAIIDNSLGDKDIAVFKHPRRSCIYREHDACRRLRKDDFDVMRQQMEYYQFIGYPMNNGLSETSCIIRRNNGTTSAFNEEWWQIVAQYSHRDQLSFDFVLWRQQLSCGVVAGCRDRSPYFIYYPHIVKRVRQ